LKKKKELDTTDLYFEKNQKYWFIYLSFYDSIVKNETLLKLGDKKKSFIGVLDTTFNSKGNIEKITISYKLKKMKTRNNTVLKIISKDLCVDYLLIPLYDFYDFIDINYQNKYVIYRNRIFITE
jgi:hypothetical protein